MPGIFAVLAGGIVLFHLAFVAFVVGGALLTWRWPRLSWVHLAAVGWAAYIEFTGDVCPLTPLENALRARAGLEYYSGDFVARHLFPVLYPDGLTRETQVVFGLLVVLVNASIYGFIYAHRRFQRR